MAKSLQAQQVADVDREGHIRNLAAMRLDGGLEMSPASFRCRSALEARQCWRFLWSVRFETNRLQQVQVRLAGALALQPILAQRLHLHHHPRLRYHYRHPSMHRSNLALHAWNPGMSVQYLHRSHASFSLRMRCCYPQSSRWVAHRILRTCHPYSRKGSALMKVLPRLRREQNIMVTDR